MTSDQLRDLVKQHLEQFRNDSGERGHRRKAGDAKRRASHRVSRRRTNARIRATLARWAG